MSIAASTNTLTYLINDVSATTTILLSDFNLVWDSIVPTYFQLQQDASPTTYNELGNVNYTSGLVLAWDTTTSPANSQITLTIPDTSTAQTYTFYVAARNAFSRAVGVRLTMEVCGSETVSLSMQKMTFSYLV